MNSLRQTSASSFYELLLAHAHQDPDRPALMQAGHIWSYRSFVQLIDERRIWLDSAGVLPGQSVVILVGHHIHTWLILLALRAMGVSTISISQVHQIKALGLEKYDHLLAFEDQGALSREAVHLLGIPSVLVVPVRFPKPVTPADAHAAFEPRSGAGHVLYTSGTTGVYKKLRIDEVTDTLVAKSRADWFGYDRNTIFGEGGIGTWTAIGYKQPLAVWAAGGCVLFSVPGQLWRDFNQFRITHTYLIPPGVTELLRQAYLFGGTHHDFQLMIGAGFLSEAHTCEAQAKLTPHITFTYGSTEVNTPPMRLDFQGDDVYWYTPSAPDRIEVVDEQGMLCPPGQEGALRVKLTKLDFRGYLEDPSATSSMFREGYFYPGDMAIMRANGGIRVTGRTSDVLIIKGQKFTAVTHEQRLQRRLGGIEVCLLSGIDPQGQEVVVVALQASPSAEHGHAIKETLTGPLFSRMIAVYFARFPRNDTGTEKIKRSEIRQILKTRALIQ